MDLLVVPGHEVIHGDHRHLLVESFLGSVVHMWLIDSPAPHALFAPTPVWDVRQTMLLELHHH